MPLRYSYSLYTQSARPLCPPRLVPDQVTCVVLLHSVRMVMLGLGYRQDQDLALLYLVPGHRHACPTLHLPCPTKHSRVRLALAQAKARAWEQGLERRLPANMMYRRATAARALRLLLQLRYVRAARAASRLPRSFRGQTRVRCYVYRSRRTILPNRRARMRMRRNGSCALRTNIYRCEKCVLFVYFLFHMRVLLVYTYVSPSLSVASVGPCGTGRFLFLIPMDRGMDVAECRCHVL